MPVPNRLKRFESAWHDAVAKVHHRRLHDTPTKRRMMDVSERYDGSIIYALDDVEGEPAFPGIAASIIADAIDANATRANSTQPVLTAPAVDPEKQSHQKRARVRRHAWASTWGESQLMLRLGRAYRQLFGYATFCLAVQPDFETKRPVITTRNPLLAYPEPMNNDEVRAPKDIGFVYGLSPVKLMAMYPEIAQRVKDETSDDDDIWDILDWTDGEMQFIGLLGKRGAESFQRRYDPQGSYSRYGDNPIEGSFLLRAEPNKVGFVPVVCPQQVSLDRQMSAISRIIGHTDLMNKIAAMQFISAEKSIWPYIFALGQEGRTPEIVGGDLKDGRSGEVNLLENVRDIQTLNLQPAPAADVLMANIERNARLTTGNPSIGQGEMQPSLRSGQTINQLTAASIDPRLQEAHNTMSYALKVINEAVAATEVGHWPMRRYTVFSEWPGTQGHRTYQPAKIWAETTKNVVSYPAPGIDAQGANIILTQLQQTRMISRRSARAHHPLVSQMDPEAQDQEIMSEAVDDAISMSMIQLVASGQFAVTDLAKVRKLVREGKLIEDAIDQVQQEAQRRQATAAEVPVEEGMVAPPEAMPGINAPEAGGQVALPPPPAEPQGMRGQFDALTAALMSQGGPGAA